MARRTQKKPHPLFLNPVGKMTDFDYGVLRSEFHRRKNSTVAYAEGKLRLCARSEVLLPQDAHDLFADPGELWRSFEAARLPDQRDLATCVTLYLPQARTLHAAYEEVRAYARAEFAVARGLPTLLVMHAPGHAGSGNDVHAHLMVAARRLRAWGWGEFSDLCRDRAQGELHKAWLTHRASWGQP